MFDVNISRINSIVDRRAINYMRNHFAFIAQMLFKSKCIQTQKIHIIRYKHGNIFENDDDIDDENNQVMKNMSIARTLA